MSLKNVTKPVRKPVTSVKRRGRGRPTLKTSKLINEFLSRINSGLNIVEICEADDMPSRDSIHHWLAEDADFSDKYVRACQVRREVKFYELEKVAKTEEDVQRARLLVDVVKWQLSKEEPKKYGDKVDLTTNGKDMPQPIYGGLNALQGHNSDAEDLQPSE